MNIKKIAVSLLAAVMMTSMATAAIAADSSGNTSSSVPAGSDTSDTPGQENTYTVSLPPEEEGYTITLSEGRPYAQGETVTVTVKPDPNYKVLAVYYSSVGSEPVEGTDNWTFTMPAMDVEIRVSIYGPCFSISYEHSNDYGFMYPPMRDGFLAGEAVDFLATSFKEGYKISKVFANGVETVKIKDDEKDHRSSQWSFIMPEKDVVLTAELEPTGDPGTPDTSEPDTSDDTSSTPFAPDTSDTSSSASDNTSGTPDKTTEFVPAPVVDGDVDEETAKVIAEIKVSAPEAAFEAGTTLAVKKDDSVDGENTFALDITFTLNGTAVQPKDGATVTVSVPVPPKFKDVSEDMLKVFHYLNGSYTRVEATVSDGTVTFETSHFSTYVISPDNLETNNPPESSTAEPETPNASNGNPQTGIAVSVLPIVMAISAIIVIKSKK